MSSRATSISGLQTSIDLRNEICRIAQAVHRCFLYHHDACWPETLRSMADATITQAKNKFWNFEVRTVPAFYRRFVRDGILTLTSAYGVERRIASAYDLAQLLLPLLEAELCEHYQVQCDKNAFFCITSFTRIHELKTFGWWPCPSCVHYFRGEQGLWWHCQQQHKSSHEQAVQVAWNQRMTKAMVVYNNNNNNPQHGEDVMLLSQQQSQHQPNPSTTHDDVLNCIKRGDLATARTFISQHSLNPHAIDSKGATPLLWAAGGGHLALVRYLVEECHCDPDTGQKGKRAFAGRTALHWAARNNHLEIVRYLVDECLVQLEAATADGTTAFCWAAWQGHTEILQYLYDHGCECNSINRFGCNAVLWATQGRGDPPLLNWLGSIGCSLWQINENGHGVLHKAAQRGRNDICEWFAEDAMTDLNSNEPEEILRYISPDNDGCTPSDLAGMEGHGELALWLVNIEANLVQQCLRRGTATTPSWFSKAPTAQHTLLWEPWAGVSRMRATLSLASTSSSTSRSRKDKD